MTDKDIAEEFIRETENMSYIERLIALYGGIEMVCDGDNWTIVEDRR